MKHRLALLALFLPVLLAAEEKPWPQKGDVVRAAAPLTFVVGDWAITEDTVLARTTKGPTFGTWVYEHPACVPFAVLRVPRHPRADGKDSIELKASGGPAVSLEFALAMRYFIQGRAACAEKGPH